jgi:hypothetical protein
VAVAVGEIYARSRWLAESASSHYKSWKVTVILSWSALLFVAGFITRAIGAWHFGNLGLFISSIVLIYAAPYVSDPLVQGKAP